MKEEIIGINETYSSVRPPIPPQNQNQEYIFIPGNFEYIEDSNTRNMLSNAYKSIDVLELWDYMKKDSESFMLSSDKEINIISEKMKELGYDLHSGFSFGWTMRQIQYIAIHGEQNYRKYRSYN